MSQAPHVETWIGALDPEVVNFLGGGNLGGKNFKSKMMKLLLVQSTANSSHTWIILDLSHAMRP